METKEPIVIISKISRTFQEDQVPVNAIVDISLEVYKNELTAFMGASGSGKSTLLNQIALIEKVDSGSIIIEKKEVTKLSETERARFRLNNLGYVFQFLNLFEELNIFENVCLPLRLLGRHDKQGKKYAQELLEYFDLGGKRLKSYPNELSGGQQQKVAIARALVKKPAIILADEPTANLDWNGSVATIELLKRIQKDFGQTIILVTHEPELGAMTDRIVELRDGRIVKDERNS